MTISPEDEHGKPQSENRQGAAAANLSGSSTSPSQLPVFAAMQGTGHRLGGAETGVRFGGNSEHEKRRAALAAAERRMRAPLG